MIYKNVCCKINNKKLSIIFICILLLINPFSHFVKNILGIGNTYYVGYLSWFFLFIYAVFWVRSGITWKEAVIAMFVIIASLIGFIHGDLIWHIGLENMHVCISMSLSYLCVMGLFSNVYIDEKQLLKILTVVLIAGVLSSVYAIITQSEYAINVMRGHAVSYNAWLFTSFYRQRNIFAAYCYISSFSAGYIYIKKKKIIYLFLLLLGGIEIFITNSRASLLAYLVLIGMYIYLTNRNRYVIIFFSIIGLLLFFYTIKIDGIFVNFHHATSTGTDSGTERIKIWKSSLDYLNKNTGWIFGLGIQSIDNYLNPLWTYSSNHNAYVDTLFESGLFLLFIIGRSISIIIRRVMTSNDLQFKYAWISLIFSFCIYCLFESSCALYKSNFFSLTFTLIIVLLPRLYLNQKDT